MGELGVVGGESISVLVADDSLIIREGATAMLAAEAGVQVVGAAVDYDTLVAAADWHEPQVIVCDIRMPPNFQREGIDACKEVRRRHPAPKSSSCPGTTIPTTPSPSCRREPPATPTR
jgi:DNA-binding NarL/FixJ family response regulator